MREPQVGAKQAAPSSAEPPEVLVERLVQAEPGVSALVVLVVLLVLVARLVPAEYLGQMLVGVRVLRMLADQTEVVELLAAPELVEQVAKVALPVLLPAKVAYAPRSACATRAITK